jgi:hypothetical protein
LFLQEQLKGIIIIAREFGDTMMHCYMHVAKFKGHREVEALLLQHGTEEDEEDDDEADGEDDDDDHPEDDDDYDPFFDEEYEEDDDELDFLSLLHMICAAL